MKKIMQVVFFLHLFLFIITKIKKKKCYIVIINIVIIKKRTGGKDPVPVPLLGDFASLEPSEN